MLPFKAVVSDLDGTLLNLNGRISSTTLTTLSNLNECGVEIILATGRHPKDALQVSEELKDKVNIIGLNGALTLCKDSGNLINNKQLKYRTILELLELIEHDNLHLNIFDQQGWKIHEVNEMVEGYSSHSGFSYSIILPSEVMNLNINKFLLWREDDISDVEKKINHHLGGKVTCYRTSNNQIEIGPPDVSKASAVIQLLSEKGISFQKQAIAFGDALNDLSMLNQAAKGVLMQNSMPELIELLSTLSVTGTNEEDGVAHFLNQTFDI
ncbi:Cof-type HAD-IIB family hydrolase [Vibrio jasicida]|uniref:Cof-type HAD-IIB family hydrolase n=1 Tax=Vibrio jasicida TaxID=766224 RepID=UPI0005EF96D2|nr:Cof-type HAD-IIB family hydrolase [Vibrio jasicida]